ncbi:hypothetical protein [Phormidium nigroviride]
MAGRKKEEGRRKKAAMLLCRRQNEVFSSKNPVSLVGCVSPVIDISFEI